MNPTKKQRVNITIQKAFFIQPQKPTGPTSWWVSGAFRPRQVPRAGGPGAAPAGAGGQSAGDDAEQRVLKLANKQAKGCGLPWENRMFRGRMKERDSTALRTLKSP